MIFFIFTGGSLARNNTMSAAVLSSYYYTISFFLWWWPWHDGAAWHFFKIYVLYFSHLPHFFFAFAFFSGLNCNLKTFPYLCFTLRTRVFNAAQNSNLFYLIVYVAPPTAAAAATPYVIFEQVIHRTFSFFFLPTQISIFLKCARVKYTHGTSVQQPHKKYAGGSSYYKKVHFKINQKNVMLIANEYKKKKKITRFYREHKARNESNAKMRIIK